MSRALLFLQHFPRRRCAWTGYWLVVRPVGFPAALYLAGLLAGGAACGIPGGAALGRATGWWCGLWDTRRRCAWTGYSLVVRPVGFPAALRLDWLLVGGAACGFPGGAAPGRAIGGAACGMGSPGEAFMPTPGRFTGAICEKSPYFRTSSHLEYGGEGGLTRFARPCGAARLLRSRSVQLAAPVVEPRSGVLIPPTENIKEKSPYFRTSSYLEYGGEGGIDSLRSPVWGSPLTAFAVCPTGCASCRTPVGGSHPPNGEYKRKEPVLSYELLSRIWR